MIQEDKEKRQNENNKRIDTRSIKKPVNVDDKNTVLQDLLNGGKGNIEDR